MFNLDLYKLLMQLLPVSLRTGKMVAWLQVLIFPAVQVYNRFTSYRNDKLYELSHNGQVYSMENVFNDRFDNDLRRIYITDGLTKDRFYIFTRNELKTKYLKKFIYNREDYSDTGVDFIVWVPNAVSFAPDDLIELKALVNKYKIDPKGFKVYRA